MNKCWDDRIITDQERIKGNFGEYLKPCPFCNCPLVGLYLSPIPHITCRNCNADGPSFEGSKDTLDERQHKAVKAWNNAIQRP